MYLSRSEPCVSKRYGQPGMCKVYTCKQILAQITEGLNEYVREVNAHLQKHNGITSPFFAYVWL